MTMLTQSDSKEYTVKRMVGNGLFAYIFVVNDLGAWRESSVSREFSVGVGTASGGRDGS